MTLNESRRAYRVRVAETDSNFFQALGAEPYFGRSFSPDEDIKGKDNVAVIGYGLWQQAFGGDPRVLGATLRLNGVSQMIVGVAPPDFDFPARAAVWAPTTQDIARLPKRGAFFNQIVGGLKPGMSFSMARAMHDAEIQRALPAGLRQKGTPTAEMRSLRDQLAGPVRQAYLVLLAAVAFVLLIACANVAQLLLFAASERRKELAIRMALGASRARLTRQLIVEAIALTLPAALAGLFVARAVSRAAQTLAPAALDSQGYTILDWRVLGVTLALALLTGIVFGVLPGLADSDFRAPLHVDATRIN